MLPIFDMASNFEDVTLSHVWRTIKRRHCLYTCIVADSLCFIRNSTHLLQGIHWQWCFQGRLDSYGAYNIRLACKCMLIIHCRKILVFEICYSHSPVDNVKLKEFTIYIGANESSSEY